MTIKSIKHSKEKRVLIPSREEAGQESSSPRVKGGKEKADFPVNPVVHRGQDPELFWMHKYGADDREDRLKVDIRSLYRHEHIAPEKIIGRLYQLKEVPDAQQTFLNGLFGHGLKLDEIDKVSEYYQHADDWTNRMIQGDSQLVMTSLLEREGMAGKVQMIYIDPPYGIKYGSNWQMKLNKRSMSESQPDEELTGEPEQIKAYRDTWELGIHSYLGYLRDRLLVAKELLSESGSCFVQISDENVHLVRSLMDEVFGGDNFVSQIAFQTKNPLRNAYIPGVCDYIIWYGKRFSDGAMKYRKLFQDQDVVESEQFSLIEYPDGRIESVGKNERSKLLKLPEGARVFTSLDLSSSGRTESCVFDFEWNGKIYRPTAGKSWKTNLTGMKQLADQNRLYATQNALRYKLYYDDYPVVEVNNLWTDTAGASGKLYVVQTGVTVIQRCMLMATDPGDLVLDPTCGSGTTAVVAEEWGRRWIAIDTSRIALNISKTRLLSSTYPYYKLYDDAGSDIRQGFVYKKVPHVTLGQIAQQETLGEEILVDQPEFDRKKLRVSGPFTVETLQNFEPIAAEELDKPVPDKDELESFEERIFEHMKSAGIKNGIRNEQAVFMRVDRLNSAYLHAEGFYQSAKGEKKAYIHIGPKFGTVSRQAVNEAVKECRTRGDADWLIILGFSFESNIENQSVTASMGTFEVTKVRMHDDLMQDGLLKRDKKAASFVTIGEPDIVLNELKSKKNEPKAVQVEIRGLDIYDPVTDEVKPRDVADIAYWMVDDDYDGSNFMVRQVFFCGGDKDEFNKWKRGLSDLAKSSTKRNAEKTLKIEIDDEAFDRIYGHLSHPIEIKKKTQKIAVRVISQFGEECTKVLGIT
ncbi:MAG TPA: site-specific DNA-methyltransferase [Kiritimatiellia bacterium]|nr:site-specific DNA-methyltransferase [Kiritimatiellia bacterium]HMO98124.1 site-specific DNA-methyltransferase [Kiritimatiellia bacterium]HMP96181.1 site-specific DNA-methyltransferase [Kiritimatiellia bacterium]